MIKEIREYTKLQIYNVDPDMLENESAFYDGDIGEGNLETTYQIAINNILNNVRDSHFEDNIEVIVSIFGFGYTDEVVLYDELLDKAVCIRDNIISIANFNSYEDITNVQSNGINAEQLPGDDNGFKIDINFTFIRAYSRG
jgi:hypothetical protein